jgi:hypothetical protein
LIYSAFESDDPAKLTEMDKFNMDLCEMLHCSMSELDSRVDAFEHTAWLHRWHESRFGSRWLGYYLAQISGHVANVMGGKKWYVHDYTVHSHDIKVAPEQSESEQEALAYDVMLVFGGKEKADKWKRDNANN